MFEEISFFSVTNSSFPPLTLPAMPRNSHKHSDSSLLIFNFLEPSFCLDIGLFHPDILSFGQILIQQVAVVYYGRFYARQRLLSLWRFLFHLESRRFACFADAVLSKFSCCIFMCPSWFIRMGEPSNKKAKSMPVRAPRVRFTIQLKIEPGMEERLERVKSSIQRVKRNLSIHSQTPQGNF